MGQEERDSGNKKPWPKKYQRHILTSERIRLDRVVHVCNPSPQEAEKGDQYFKTTLSYMESSRPAWAAQ